MGEIVNLRRVRKAKARDAAAQAAAGNRALHGQSKQAREAVRQETVRVLQRLEGHRRDDS
jgi:hypothetical protein